METRANYVAIGLFVIFVLASALGALYWLYRSAEPGATQLVRIIFPEPVTGLSNGGSVLFNGIRVGEVVELDFPEGGGDNVIAVVRVTPEAPIKTDTTATLGFQGLTGVAYISLTGGSLTAPSLFAEGSAAMRDEGVPVVVAETSTFTSVLDSAQSVLARLNTTLDEVNGIIDDNRDDVTAVVANVRTMSEALAETAPEIRGLVGDVAGAARSVADTVPQLGSVVTRANDLLGAVEPQRVASIVENVDGFTATLPEIGTELQGFVTSVGTDLEEAAGTLGEAFRAVNDLVAAVNETEVRAIVDGVGRTVSAVSERSGALATALDNTASITSDLSGLTSAIADRGPVIATAIDDAGALVADARGAVNAAVPAIRSASEAIAAVTPERVGAVLDGAEALTRGLSDLVPEARATLAIVAGRAETIGETLDNAATISRDVAALSSTVAGRAEAIGTAIDDLSGAASGAPQLLGTLNRGARGAEDLIAALDAAAINAAVTDVERVAEALADRTPEIADGLAGTLSGTQTLVDGLNAELPAIRSTIVSVNEFTGRLPGLADSIAPGLQNAGAALAAVDPEALPRIVSNTDSLVATLADQAEPFAALVSNAASAAERIDTIADALTLELPQLSSMVDAAEGAAEQVGAFSNRLPAIGEALQSGVASGRDALAALDGEAISALVSDAGSFVASLADQRENIAALVNRAGEAAGAVGELARGLADQMPDIGGIIDSARAAAASVRDFAADLPGIGDLLGSAAEDTAAALDAVDPAAVNALVTNASEFAGALNEQSAPLADLIGAAGSAARDASTVTAEFSARAEAIGIAVDDLTRTASDASGIAADVREGTQALVPAAQQAAEAIAVVSPARVDDVLTNIQLASAGIVQQSDNVETIMTNARAVSADARILSAALAERTGVVTGVIEDAGRAASSVATAAERAPALVTRLEPGVANLSDVLAAVDPSAVSGIVSDAQSVSAMLAGEAPKVGPLIDAVSATVDNARVISTRLRGELTTVEAALQNANSALAEARTFTAALPDLVARVEPGVGNLSDALLAVEPEAISEIIANINEVTATVAGARENVDLIVANATQASASVNRVASAAAERTEAIGRGIDGAARFAETLGDQSPRVAALVSEAERTLGAVSGAVGELDGETVNAILADIQRVTSTVSARTEEIAAAIDNATRAARDLAEGLGSMGEGDSTIEEVLDGARTIVRNLEGASAQVSGVVENVDRLLAGPVPGFVSTASGAAISVQNVADAFASRADTIAGGLARFSSGGLDDLRAILNQGRVTLAAIESAVSSFDRNPSRVIFGGGDAPTYAPQRR